MTASQGREFIARAISTAQATGYMPELEELAVAVEAVRAGLDESQFSTAFEQRRATLQLAAELAVLAKQEYKIGDRSLKRADLAEIRAGIEAWDRRVKALSSTNNGIGRSITPRPLF